MRGISKGTLLCIIATTVGPTLAVGAVFMQVIVVDGYGDTLGEYLLSKVHRRCVHSVM